MQKFKPTKRQKLIGKFLEKNPNAKEIFDYSGKQKYQAAKKELKLRKMLKSIDK